LNCPPSGDTRSRLLAAAGEVFAEAGFEHATVREICRRAGANVAAVNYHFGDKLGLYTDLVLSQIRFVGEAAAATACEGPPEEQLREFITRYLHGLLGKGKPAWAWRLTALEVFRPSPVLKTIVDEILRPTEYRLRGLISEIVGLPKDDDKVRMCAHSIVGQCLHYRHAEHVLAHLWPSLWEDPDRLQRLADHIVQFSLSALHAIRKERRKDGRKKSA
jgi:TetR/AcrR family transcriptional regulator, regulator of cefoperazone and chloramphenicol sensitivity